MNDELENFRAKEICNGTGTIAPRTLESAATLATCTLLIIFPYEVLISRFSISPRNTPTPLNGIRLHGESSCSGLRLGEEGDLVDVVRLALFELLGRGYSAVNGRGCSLCMTGSMDYDIAHPQV